MIGANKTKYIDEAVGALNVKLTDAEIAYLEEPYVPHPIRGAVTEKESQALLKRFVK